MRKKLIGNELYYIVWQAYGLFMFGHCAYNLTGVLMSENRDQTRTYDATRRKAEYRPRHFRFAPDEMCGDDSALVVNNTFLCFCHTTTYL